MRRLMGVGIMLLAVCASAAAQSPAGTPGTVLSAPGGRYVFGQVSSGRIDQYMLDTQTGRIWQLQCAKKAADGFGCDASVFVSVPFQWPAGSPDNYGLTPVPALVTASPPIAPGKK